MKKKIAIVHYLPLEYYPPVTNFLNYAVSNDRLKINVYSTNNNKNRKEYINEGLNLIKRFSLPDENDNNFERIFKYLKFNLFSFISLIINNPKEILYFESFSAAPVYWYLRLFGKNKRLRIHYHEYDSPDWYKNGMRLVKIYHKYEQEFLYKKANWISQTNSKRIELFLKDNPQVNEEKMQILPNYPPKSWLNKTTEIARKEKKEIKTVYVGSLSLKDTYIKEYCEWVVKQNGKVTFDIFSYNLHDDTKIYLKNLNSEEIRFFNEGLKYDSIPQVLKDYDVGLILYKALTDNFKYNAPNKLFEYMACGLEIWFSVKMKGCVPYIRAQNPRIIPVDFLNIENVTLLKAKTGIPTSISQKYTAEEALAPLINELAGK
jgi:hypothetical protein